MPAGGRTTRRPNRSPGYDPNAARTRRRAAVRAAGTTFIGVDGEGWTDALGQHHYAQLSVGDKTLFGADHLHFTEICEFLWTCFLDNERAAYVGFFLSYDFSQWLRTLPEERAKMLLTPQGVAKRKRTHSGGNTKPFPVEYQGFEFDMLGDKRFRLRKINGGSDHWMNICDVGAFFQTAFLAVIDPKKWPDGPVCTDEEWATILEGKAHRADDWTRESWLAAEADLTKYNVAENVVLARVMARYEEGLRAEGVFLSRDQWFGPGQAAQGWMKKIGLVTGEEVRAEVPEEVLEFGRRSYYGGWFEVFAHGIIPGESWEADITSAYPHAMTEMPCFRHGTWVHQTELDPCMTEWNAYSLVDITTRGSDSVVGSMMHRRPDGTILRPYETRGVRWGFELNAAVAAGLIDSWEPHERWYFREGDCECDPLSTFAAQLPHMFQRRHDVGKDTSQGKAIKLIMNSAYGKQAQSIGSPRYSNSLAASFITAHCRTAILRAIAAQPDGTAGLLMVATDGVYFRSRPVGLDEGSELGKWELQAKHNLTVVMPGVHYDDKARSAAAQGKVAVRSRGIPGAAFSAQLHKLDEKFRTLPEDPSDPSRWPTLDIPIKFQVTSPRLALHQGKWEKAGSVARDVERKLSTDPSSKRLGPGGFLALGLGGEPYTDATGVVRSYPYPTGGKDVESTPYQNTFGGPVDDDLLLHNVITPDGSVRDEFNALTQGELW